MPKWKSADFSGTRRQHGAKPREMVGPLRTCRQGTGCEEIDGIDGRNCPSSGRKKEATNRPTGQFTSQVVQRFNAGVLHARVVRFARSGKSLQIDFDRDEGQTQSLALISQTRGRPTNPTQQSLRPVSRPARPLKAAHPPST